MKRKDFFFLRYLQLGPDTVSMIASIAAITQHHAFCITLLSTHFTASIEDGLWPDDTSIQCRQMKEDLGQAGRRKKWLSPAIQNCFIGPSTITGIFHWKWGLKKDRKKAEWSNFFFKHTGYSRLCGKALTFKQIAVVNWDNIITFVLSLQ